MIADSGNNNAQPRALAALANSQVHELRVLRVELLDDGQSLLLHGRVSSFYHKQLAQETVRAACAGINVVNTIRVSS